MRTLAITGLFSPWGRRMARLASDFGIRVLGIDIKPMTRPFDRRPERVQDSGQVPDSGRVQAAAGVEFVEADIRNPLISELFKAEQVDAILHCAFRWRQQPTEEVFDSNVMGTMRLLGAAALAGVRKVILPSSTFVYGAHPGNPCFLTEESDFRGQPQYAYVRELREIETFVSGFRRQHPHMIVTVLRFANILGGGVTTPMAGYLSLPAAPALLGFDPMLQFIDHQDVLRALGHCLMDDYNGVYNVAAPEPLPLLKALALAGVPPAFIFHPLAYHGLQWGRMLNRQVDRLAPLPCDYLRYGWVGDTTRMRVELDFEAVSDAESVLRAFGAQLRQHRYDHSSAYRFAVQRWRDARGAGAWARTGLAEASSRAGAAMRGLRGQMGGDGEP